MTGVPQEDLLALRLAGVIQPRVRRDLVVGSLVASAGALAGAATYAVGAQSVAPFALGYAAIGLGAVRFVRGLMTM